MSGYISREVMLKNLNADLEHHADEGDPLTILIMQRFIRYVEDFPTVGVQPVIRCKDCRYAQNPNDTMVYCTYFECGTMSPDDFCSQGERIVM